LSRLGQRGCGNLERLPVRLLMLWLSVKVKLSPGREWHRSTTFWSFKG
jgi:hypothetical protein